jgi:hypothetical protein
LVDSHAEALVRKALGLADEGDSQMLRFLLGRILPPKENAPLKTGPLPMGSAEELSQSSQKLMQKVTSGEVSLSDASGITVHRHSQTPSSRSRHRLSRSERHMRFGKHAGKPSIGIQLQLA